MSSQAKTVPHVPPPAPPAPGVATAAGAGEPWRFAITFKVDVHATDERQAKAMFEELVSMLERVSKRSGYSLLSSRAVDGPPASPTLFPHTY